MYKYFHRSPVERRFKSEGWLEKCKLFVKRLQWGIPLMSYDEQRIIDFMDFEKIPDYSIQLRLVQVVNTIQGVPILRQ